jgi:hypothetical protein
MGKGKSGRWPASRCSLCQSREKNTTTPQKLTFFFQPAFTLWVEEHDAQTFSVFGYFERNLEREQWSDE